MDKQQHQQTLRGANQINMTVAMMLQTDIPFSILSVKDEPMTKIIVTPADAKEFVQKFALVAGDLDMEQIAEKMAVLQEQVKPDGKPDEQG